MPKPRLRLDSIFSNMTPKSRKNSTETPLSNDGTPKSVHFFPPEKKKNLKRFLKKYKWVFIVISGIIFIILIPTMPTLVPMILPLFSLLLL